MHATHLRPTYTGTGHHQHQHHHHQGGGFCAGCCHPRSSCCCWCRECRKESKELLVEPTRGRADLKEQPDLMAAVARMSLFEPVARTLGGGEEDYQSVASESIPSHVMDASLFKLGKFGFGTAFIGGGCCVHLSIEYAPAGAADGLVGVLVQDSQDTSLAWVKKVHAGLGYQIKEGIITTKPGAHLTALAVGATARVRWCEVFSC